MPWCWTGSPGPTYRSSRSEAALLEGLREQGLSALPWTKSSRQLSGAALPSPPPSRRQLAGSLGHCLAGNAV